MLPINLTALGPEWGVAYKAKSAISQKIGIEVLWTLGEYLLKYIIIYLTQWSIQLSLIIVFIMSTFKMYYFSPNLYIIYTALGKICAQHFAENAAKE